MGTTQEFSPSAATTPEPAVRTPEQNAQDARRYHAFVGAMIADINGKELTAEQRAVRDVLSADDTKDPASVDELSALIDEAIKNAAVPK